MYVCSNLKLLPFVIAVLSNADQAAKEHKEESNKAKERIETLRTELQEERDALRDSMKNGEMQAQEMGRLKADLDKALQVNNWHTIMAL